MSDDKRPPTELQDIITYLTGGMALLVLAIIADILLFAASIGITQYLLKWGVL